MTETAAVSDRIVAAAAQCFERYGVPKTTLDDIAGAAGLSRSTVYRYFPGGRDALIVTVVVSDAVEFLAEAAQWLPPNPSVADIIVDGVMQAADFVRTRPGLREMFSPESVGQTALVTSVSAAMMDTTVRYLGPFLDAARATGQVRAELDTPTAAEVLLRMVFSLLTVPGLADRDDEETRRFLHAAIVPAFIPDHAPT